ncbi:PREDICTED: HAUS augmin-like complex subunit 5 isoform X2 [Priapulus caudatus]|uniref:HAUS augmin-like complex subunit 5 isoform X2 n=1 Tax=Priapulus caudatus TaxID=37621 RepID=A0ABM1F7N1_PRICU|nr:PREDICTED: HAUS augmin-like complex subunit 5 isoform X2 [Priapulus caudatus]
MKYCPCLGSSYPTEEDLASLCKGPMVGIWSYLIQHVHHTETVNNVRGNLKLQAHLSSDPACGSHLMEEQIELLKHKSRLDREIAGTLSATELVNKHVKQLNTEITNTEKLYKKQCCQIKESRQRTAMLSARISHWECERTRLTELDTQLTDLMTLGQAGKRMSSGGAKYYTKKGSIAEEETDLHLETAAMKDVREACELLQNILSKDLQAASLDKTMEAGLCLPRMEQVDAAVERLLADHSSEEVLTAMIQNCRSSACQLQQRIEHVDPKKDLEDVKKKLGNGKLTEMHQKPCIKQSVQDLLQLSCMEHIRRHAETRQHVAKACRTQESLQLIQFCIQALLIKMFKADTVALSLAQKVISTQLSNAADVACLQYLQQEAKHYQETAEKANQHNNELKQKYEAIQGFKAIVEKKQRLINALLHRNGSMKPRLEALRSENLSFVRTNLRVAMATVSEHALQLQKSLYAETDLFGVLRLPLLMTTTIDSGVQLKTIELSINRFEYPSLQVGGPLLESLLLAIDFPPYKAPESLLPFIVRRKHQLAEAQFLCDARAYTENRILELHGGKTFTDDSVEEVISRVSCYDDGQLQTTLPAIQDTLLRVARALASCQTLSTLVDEWKQQPAQYVVPWVTVDGRNLQQWKDTWSVQASRHVS